MKKIIPKEKIYMISDTSKNKERFVVIDAEKSIGTFEEIKSRVLNTQRYRIRIVK